MASWIDAPQPIQQFHDTNMQGSGTGSGLAGQHDVTHDERAALNHDLDTYKFNSATKLQANGGTQTATDAMVAAFRIGQASDELHWKPEDKQAYLKAAQQMPLGDLNDPAARMKAMSFISQDKPNKDGESNHGTGAIDQSACAGASIVGAAFLAEGPAGLQAVMKAIEKQDPSGNQTGKFASPEYKALKAKLATDPNSLTVADIQTLQQTTLHVLEDNQAKAMRLDPNAEKPTGIGNKEMDDFMKKSPELAKMFKKNGMEVQSIDNDGALDDSLHTSPDHYVVRMTGKDGKQAIYDPNARRGGQVIDFDAGVDLYNKATQDTIGDEHHPY